MIRNLLLAPAPGSDIGWGWLLSEDLSGGGGSAGGGDVVALAVEAMLDGDRWIVVDSDGM